MTDLAEVVAEVEPQLHRYGAGAVDPAVVGTRGAQLARLADAGAPVPVGVTIPLGLPLAAARELAVEAVAAVAAAPPPAGTTALLRLSASTVVPAAGLPPACLGLGLTAGSAAEAADLYDEPAEVAAAWAGTLRLLAELALGVPTGEVAGVALEHPAPTDQVAALLDLCARAGVRPLPEEPAEQVALAIDALHTRWLAPRAQRARRAQSLPADLGLALHLEARPIAAAAGTGFGVVSSRDGDSGRPGPVGRFGYGLDVSGESGAHHALADLPADVDAVTAVLGRLEAEHGRIVSVRFDFAGRHVAAVGFDVAERVGARATTALAVDLVHRGVRERTAALTDVEPRHVEELLHPQVVLTGREQLLVSGLAASPGAATGALALSSDRAVSLAEQGTPVVLVMAETSPADLPGMLCAQAIVTANGGVASHAAVVARGIGRPAVCGAAALHVGVDHVVAGDLVVAAGETISVNGSTGEVYLGEVSVRAAGAGADLTALLGWADAERRLGVRANADGGPDTATAISLGADGVGLCRTEHQFLGDRLPLIRRVILAPDVESESAALAELAEAQREDFTALLRAVGDRPVTVRLLDAPMHEFLPAAPELAESPEQYATAESLREANPMLGVRGVRLALLHEGLYPAQVRALLTSWLDVARDGIRPQLEIMVPLVSIPGELAHVAAQIRRCAAEVAAATGQEVPFRIGTMVETPRAALMADKLAAIAEFISFGTNDLTQLTYGFSRDDVERRVLTTYVEHGLLTVSPFTELDPDGVGALVAMAAERARSTRPDIKLGLCGEHGGDPVSIRLAEQIGLDYVSCSPHRVPVARLAAAQARLEADDDRG